MNPFADLKNAALGWIDLIGSRPVATGRFNATRAGLLTMLGFYFLLVIVTRSVQAVTIVGAVPGVTDIAVALVFNALPILVVLAAIFITARFLKPAASDLELMVPAGYALVFLLAIGLPLSLFVGSSFAPALQGVLGYMLYRLARDIGKFSISVSIGFAILSVVLLVAVPIGLYMLLDPSLPTPD